MTHTIAPDHSTRMVMHVCMATLFCLSTLPAGTAASGDLKTALSTDDHALINSSAVEFSGCLQEKAAVHVDAHQDIRQIAARAVEDCNGILDQLAGQLDERRIDPDYYQGIVRHLKSRAIRQLLPALMIYKAQSGGGTPPPSEE